MTAKVNYVCTEENLYATTINPTVRPNKDDIILLHGNYYRIKKIIFEADISELLVNLERISRL